MECYNRIFHKHHALVLAATFLLILTSCSSEETADTVINIHGGSVGGPYNALIELLNTRAQTLRSTPVLSDDGQAPIDCETYQAGCPLLAKFNFNSICENGGSKLNLTRLGMRSKTPDPSSTVENETICQSASNNDFALVQNFFVAGAAQTYCPYQQDKFGPDFLYFFEFTPSFPFVSSITESECDQFFNDQMDGEYEKFADLRTVLPLYNGLVQFVTANRKPAVGEQAVVATLESLQQSNKKIYLRGINEIHGAEVLNRDTRFHDETIENGDHPEWLFDEEIILRRDDLATLDLDRETLEFVDSDQISESVRGDRMLACDIIGAYVISGEIIAEEDISLPDSAPGACRQDYRRQQIQISEVIINGMAFDNPSYQSLPPPAYWENTHITAMPGLITYLVTTDSADPALVYELTTALNEEWSSLIPLEEHLTPIRDNILKRPAPFHDGTEQALLELDLLGDEHLNVRIHGGSVGGPYNALIELLNTRSQTLRSTTIASVNDQAFTNCEIFREGCPLLAKFNFNSICENGGSKLNLTRLGMQSKTSNPSSTVENESICQRSSGNDFALVQNFFVAGAAQTYCPYQRDKFGPDFLYFFEFTSSFPFVGSITESECDQFFNEQMDGEYEKFEELRIVLPLYNGLVQFVTANRKPLNEDQAVVATTLEELQKSNQKIYLRGINEIYGAEVLNRDPRFHDEAIRNQDYPEWRFDENIVLRRTDLKDLSLDRETLDFIDSDEIGESERGDRMLACGIIGAYVISGEIIAEEDISLPDSAPGRCRQDYTRQQIQIPEVIIDAMVVDHPYYQKLPPPAYWAKTQITTMPGLITYLVTTDSADLALVHELTTALNEEWSSLMLLQRELTPVRDNILKKPAPFHEGAEQALLDLDLLGGGFTWPAFALILGIMIIAKMSNNLSRSKLAYNRLGEKQRLGFGSLAWQEALDFFIIILAWIFVFMFVVTMIRNWDAAIAATQNADDQISGLSFPRTLLWMFTFISSGYEDNVFPSSSASQIVVSFFAIAGIAYPLFLIAQTWDRIRLKRLSRARGGEFRGLWRLMKDWILEKNRLSHRSKGTLLLCGWNDRAPGIVYTLTCPDSPFEGTVNIVANMETEYPIEFYNFNKSRVRFYRGDASHRTHLERAEAGRAKSALILSEHSSGSGKNNAGVLSALAIERFKSEIKSEISVFAELTADEGDRKFMEQHIDNIVDPRLIARQVLTMGCFDNYVLDFVLDALSPDNHCEWYSKQVSELTKAIASNKKLISVADLSNALQKHGIAIVGICPSAKAANRSGFVAPRFDNNFLLDPLKSLESLDRELNEDDYVVCAAKDPKSFKFNLSKRRRASKLPSAAFTKSSESIIKSLRSSASILIIGHKSQAASVAEHIKDSVQRIAVRTAIVKTSIIATDTLTGTALDDANRAKLDETGTALYDAITAKLDETGTALYDATTAKLDETGTALDDAITAKLDERQWTHILLLSSIPPSHSQDEHTRLAIRADSDTILRASFIRTALIDKDAELPIIAAEVNRTPSRQLAHDADIDTVVPSSLLIERILARLVSGGGKVSELLLAMLSMQDDVYLRSTKLNDGHSLIGQNFSIALNTWYKDGRILGILPKSFSHGILNNYKNRSDDFDWHFVMCPPAAEDDRQLQEGDVVIMLACPQST